MPTKLKYTIKDRLKSAPAGSYRENVSSLIEKLDISRPSFYRMISITHDSTSSLTTDQLLIFANHFQCSVDDLINKEELV